MKKSTLFFTFAIAFMFFGCSEKSVTHYEPKEEKSIEQSLADDLSSLNACTSVYCLQRKSVTHSEPKEEKSINESLAEALLAEFQDDLGSWNACIVYDGKEYTSLDDFLNRDK